MCSPVALCCTRTAGFGDGWGRAMADSKMLKAMKATIQDFSTLEPLALVGKLRDPELIKKMKKLGASDAQIHRTILILQEHKPNSKELVAYLKSKLI
jgi:hypothetical protein